MQRYAEIYEVTKTVIFLAGQHAKKITGQVIHVDGGKNLTIRGQKTWIGIQED